MKKPGKQLNWRLGLIFLFLLGLCLAFYFTFRYGGNWIETDTAILTRYITAMQREGDLTPAGATYQHGFLFQALTVLISDLSGLRIPTLQQLIYPSLSIVLLVVSAWYFYAQASDDPSQTALAVLLLCLQGDVLFVIFRGSHEKLDWPLILLSLGLLFSSFKQRGRQLILSITLFYLVTFAQVTVNIFFATTFLAAIVLSMVLGFLLQQFRGWDRPSKAVGAGRLLYITFSVSIFAYLFISYIYPPALNNLQTMESLYQQLVSLLFNPKTAAQPYEYITMGWINRATYLGLSLFTWLLIIGSMAAWVSQGWLIIKDPRLFNLQDNLDWLLYAGFALQVGVSMVIDLSGALGKNLQLRVFPGFTLAAVLILSKSLVKVLSLARSRPITRRVMSLILVFLAAWFPVAAVLKASNEPILSNQWMIYSEGEVAAVDWAVAHLENDEIWTGIDNRIKDAYFIECGQHQENILLAFEFQENIRHVLLSEKEVLSAERIGFPLPPTFGWMILYDNGQVQLYKKPPLTPFQR